MGNLRPGISALLPCLGIEPGVLQARYPWSDQTDIQVPLTLSPKYSLSLFPTNHHLLRIFQLNVSWSASKTEKSTLGHRDHSAQTIPTLSIFGPHLPPSPPAPPQASHTPFAHGVSGVSASGVVRYRCISQDEMHGCNRVSDDIYATLPKRPNRNLQPSANNFTTQTLAFRPKNSSLLPSIGLTLGQVHQSTSALRAAELSSTPVVALARLMQSWRLSLLLFYSSSLPSLLHLLPILTSLSHL